MKILLLAVLASLSACDNSPKALRSDIEVAHSNARAALAQSEDLSSRVGELESSLEEAQRSLEQAEARIESLEAKERARAY